MKFPRRPLPLGVLSLTFALFLGSILRAQAPSTPPADHKPEVTQPAPAPAKIEPAPISAPEMVPVAPPPAAQAVPPPAQTSADPTAEKARPDNAKSAEKASDDAGQMDQQAPEAAPSEGKASRRHHRSTRDSSGDSVAVMNDNHVPAGVTVTGDAVAVMGSLTVDGEVNSDAVAVMGNNTINGIVHGNVVTVMGDVTLGPKARIEGDLVGVGGEIHRDPGAMVTGQVTVIPFGSEFKLDSVSSWWTHGLRMGRPLAIGAHLGWLWIVTGFSVAFYALLALLFPKGIRRCGDKLVRQPGLTILAALLGMLALPVLFILLCITLIGIPVALFLLPLACIMAVLYGKAAIYTLVGLKISGDRLHPAAAAIIGALLFVLFYLVPFVGLLLSVLVSFIGFGCVLLTLSTSSPKAAVQPPVAPVVPPAPPANTSLPLVVGGGAAAPIGDVPPPVSPAPPATPAAFAPLAVPPISAATLPRAGFWHRLAASALDAVLVGMLCGFLSHMWHGFGVFPFWFALYGVVMWANKGTTIGGIICGLKVVRLDDRPIDWGVAIVRGLGGFLSLAVAGLGFIWVAFDDEKQSWHDKIAGTTIVRVPKGTSLL